MMQTLHSVSDHNDSPPLSGGELNVASADSPSILLTRYLELSRDVARIRHVLEDLAQQVTSARLGAGPRSVAKRRPRRLASAPDHDGEPIQSPKSSRRLSENDETRPARSKLERACLIAMMESGEPLAVETIYHRIRRRESFTFAGYKHPFRAIVLTMGALVRHGEARLLNEQGIRRWSWDPERTIDPRLIYPPG
jgi:hypothetical protein